MWKFHKELISLAKYEERENNKSPGTQSGIHVPFDTVILLTEPFLVIELGVSTQNIFYTLGTFNPSCKWLFNLEWYSFISLERKLDVGQMEVPFSTFDLLQWDIVEFAFSVEDFQGSSSASTTVCLSPLVSVSCQWIKMLKEIVKFELWGWLCQNCCLINLSWLFQFLTGSDFVPFRFDGNYYF